MKTWRANLRAALLVAGGYLAVFLAGKLLSPNPGLPLWEWLMDHSPYNHSYLFGWLIGQKIFLYSSLVSILPALFGNYRFSAVTLTGFVLGLLLGESLGNNPGSAAYGMGHYGWAIWGGIFLVSCVMGILLQRFRREDISLKSRKLGVWLAGYLLAVLGIVVCVRMNMC